MNLVNIDGSLAGGRFKCNQYQNTYTIVSTSSTYNKDYHYRDKAIYAEHILKRADGIKRTLTTTELRERFKDITVL